MPVNALGTSCTGTTYTGPVLLCILYAFIHQNGQRCRGKSDPEGKLVLFCMRLNRFQNSRVRQTITSSITLWRFHSAGKTISSCSRHTLRFFRQSFFSVVWGFGTLSTGLCNLQGGSVANQGASVGDIFGCKMSHFLDMNKLCSRSTCLDEAVKTIAVSPSQPFSNKSYRPK